MPYRILTLDGGGIRGLVTLTLLSRLEQAVPGFLDSVDFFAGTSVGGIIALGLAQKKSVVDLTALLAKNGNLIFDKSWLRNIIDIGQLAGSEYDSINLTNLLVSEFGTTTLADCPKKVLIPAFELDNWEADPTKRTWKPVFFHNFPGIDSDEAELVVNVALSTSAAPTYFPTHGRYVDGGVVANNPSMAALTQTQDERSELNPRPTLSDVRLFSLGTGQVLNYVVGENLDWGLAHWAKPLINLLFDASAGIADYQCKMLLRGGYHRLAPVFPVGTNIPLDGWDRVQDLVNFANSVDLTETIDWLQAEFLAPTQS